MATEIAIIHKYLGLATSLILSVAAYAGPTRSAEEVVVYTSVDDVFARPIAEHFQKKTGITVKLVPDTEETKSTGLLNRLIMEKARPQADVFWSGDPIRAALLKKKGIAAAYTSSSAKDLPKSFSDPAGYWTGFSARARVLLINTDKMAGLPSPKSIYDLADLKYKGMGCMANPLFGTTSMHAAALFQVLGTDRAKAFFINLTRNQVKILSSNGEVRRRVSSGDCTFGITDTDDAFEALRDKKHVKVVFADEDGIGSLIIPNATVLIKNGPNTSAGRKFIDYLLSPETEKLLAESDAAQMPVRKHIKVPPYVRRLDEIRAMPVNYEKLGDKLEDISKSFLKAWVEQAQK